MRQRNHLLTLLALLALCAALLAQTPSPPELPASAPFDKIFLQGGDTMTGLVESINEKGIVSVTSPGTEKPVEVQLPKIRHILLNAEQNIPSNYFKRGFIFRLVDGTRITGKVVKWTAEKVTITNEYLDHSDTANVVETAEIDIAGIRDVSTSVSDFGIAWNEGKEDIIILNTGQEVKCQIMPLELVDIGGGRLYITEIKYKVGEEVKTAFINDVRGIAFPRKKPAPQAKPAEKPYALVTIPNNDRIIGVFDSLKDGKLNLTTQNMGVLHIDRKLIRLLLFLKTCSFSLGSLLVCDTSRNRVIELDADMKVVWSYDVNGPRQARRLENGNILIASGLDGRVIEVDYQKHLVWHKDGLGEPQAVVRRAIGNTLVAEYQKKRIVELRSDGSIAATYFEGECRPNFIELMENGNILVIDQDNGRVFEGSRNNKIVRTWQAKSPTCAHALADGKIAVLEDETRTISIFDSDGKIVATIPDISSGVYRFSVSAEGNIIVPTYQNNDIQKPAKIQEYSPDGKLVSEKLMPEGGFKIYSIERD